MRFLLKITVPMARGNAAIRDGSLPRTIQAILEEQRPEAAYFTEFDGKRTGLIVVDVPDSSHSPAAAEPWYQAFEATVEFHPVMTAQDLMAAGPAIARAVERYAPPA
jgi:hypothetical protein